MGLFGIFKPKNLTKELWMKYAKYDYNVCRTCKHFDMNRELCTSHNSGVTFTRADEPKCGCYEVNPILR